MIFLNKLNEDWIVDRFRKEWYEYNGQNSTKRISRAKIIWLIAPWMWKKVPTRHLISKKVICTIHHIDEEKFDDQEKENFYLRDNFVDEYHTISLKTSNQLKKLTNKNINVIPFWVNQNIWFEIKNKQKLLTEFNLQKNKFYIGSFQRDTEGNDLSSPKLSKGPDKFLDVVQYYKEQNEKVEVILTGKRRQYVIKGLEEKGISYRYFEMSNFETINKLYNCLDLYVVSSRVEGGPQSILECSITKTPIISTDVGIAAEILSPSSIFSYQEIEKANPDTEYAYKNVQQHLLPTGLENFNKMFKHHEN
ncbi:MAG: hypothetical protein CMC23_05420 [Flavobacteriaceae bacterium]|nr:hypothetical protein [Flavobacteriaceae bacterium]|tara:strand:- start:3777 stop:4694 length:918 start_codon:yes stop_codon:yes gene_type:complete